MSPEGQTAGVRREARRQWKITEMPPVNAQSLGLVELGFLRVDSLNPNQILSESSFALGTRSVHLARKSRRVKSVVKSIKCHVNHINHSRLNFQGNLSSQT